MILKKGQFMDNNDYIGSEGLLMCGRCHTRKQVMLKTPFGKVITPYCLCNCESEKLRTAETRLRENEKLINMRRRKEIAFSDNSLVNCKFENDDLINKRMTRIAKSYVEKFDEVKKQNIGIVFYGKVGTGKTFMASCIANALLEKGYSCFVTNFARLSNTIFGLNEERQKYLDSLADFDLLVIDDLAAERETTYMDEIIYNVIDIRYKSNKPIIITTNLLLVDFGNPINSRRERIYTRLKEMCTFIEFNSIDRRHFKGKEKNKAAIRLLGNDIDSNFD